MDKLLEEFRREMEKIKEFCVLVAVEHNHIPNLNRAWHNDSGNLVNRRNEPWNEDVNSLKAAIMKAILELEDRIEELEKRFK